MITSIQNQQVKNILKLKKSGKERRRQGVFVVEGMRFVSEIPEEFFVKAYATTEYLNHHRRWMEENRSEIEPKDIDRHQGEIEEVSESVMRQISDTKTPQGIVAVARMPRYCLDSILEREEGILLLLENIQDPGNLGTMIRTAEGAGVSGIIMSKDTVDIFNPKVARATMGSIFRVPFLYVEDLVDIILKLGKNGYTSFAAHLEGKDLYDEDFSGRVAFFIGNEGNGLTDRLTAKADRKIKIPMEGSLESLNAAIAAALLMYEAKRQKR